MSAFEVGVSAVEAGRPPEKVARELHGRLSEEEQLWLLDGDEEFWQGLARFRSEGYNRSPIVEGAIERLGIPGIRFVDGPRGCVAGHGTAFPVSVARGATWDISLEEQVGEVIGREIRAQGGNFFGGVCVNLPRHPAWGRAQETYGDDPYHLGEFGAALARGAQRWVMACVKHYALNSMENARFTVDVTVDEATLHDVYLPHFKRVVDEGVAAVMAAYNSVNGTWCGQNSYLLTTVLRDLWDWDGVTVTDFIWGMRDGAEALNAGMDLEEPFRQQRALRLRDQIASGETTWEMVDRAGVRLLAAQLRSYAGRVSDDPPADVSADDDSRALARAVASRAMVLLKNDPVDNRPVLPLDSASVRTIAVIGRLATAPNMGDHGSSDARPPSIVTPLDGICARLPGVDILHVASDEVSEARSAAAAADVAIVVVGYDALDEGEYVGLDAVTTPELLSLFPPLPDDIGGAFAESFAPGVEQTSPGGDRSSLSLRKVDEVIIRAVADANPSTVVVIVASGAVITESWRHLVPAVLMMWYAGMEGGHALADVLTGDHNPTGRLPFAIPTSEADLPAFERDAVAVTYDRFHGQRLLDHLEVPAAFPHGFGLSYTNFDISDAVIDSVGDCDVMLTVQVANSGERDGGHVVQVYGRSRTGPYADEAMLVGFATAFLPAGGTESVQVRVALGPLAAWEPGSRRRVIPTFADIELEIGSHAHDPSALTLGLRPF
jgi:beta-glucosidase